MSDIYKIKLANMDALRENIAKLNKKAEKLNCQPVMPIIKGTETIKATKVMPGGRILKYEYEVLLVRVTGDTPKLAGWSLVAKIEYLEDERMVLCVPGETCPEEFRTRGLECDHCKSQRNRKHVFVLRNTDGQHVQVGRSCIKDFLGGISPEQLLAQASWSFSIVNTCRDYEGEGCSRVPETINIVEYLNAVAICIRRLGWVSKGEVRWSEDSSTSSDAWTLCKPDLRTPRDEAIFNEWIKDNSLQHQERDEEVAAEALAWAVSAETTGTSDYIYNLGVACRAGYVTRKTAGIVASAISSYLKSCERQVEEARNRKDVTKTRGWVGKEKVRQDFMGLTIQYIKYIGGKYGVTTLVAFEDETGNLIRWFSSTNMDNLNQGDVVDIKATVKKHDTYRDVNQTMISRAKILTINGKKT